MLLHKVDHYGASPEFLQGYADAMRMDQRGRGKPCGKGFIPEAKKCSKQGAQRLAGDLKSSDPKVAAAAKKRVEIGKRNAQQKQAVKKQIKEASAKKAAEQESLPDSKRKKVGMKELRQGLVEAYGAKSWAEVRDRPDFKMEMEELRLKPNTQAGLRKMYRRKVGLPNDEKNADKNRKGVINGVDVKRNFLPWEVFQLNPKTATKDDIKRSFRKLAKEHHPDVGGDPEIFQRLQTMRESLEAAYPDEKPKKKSRKR